MQQFPLPISLHVDATFNNFYPGKNQLLLNCLQAMVHGHGSGESYVYLWGQSFVGRSHLLQASCQAMQERGLQSVYIPLQQWRELDVNILENLETVNLICLDDLQAIAGQAIWEEAIFHLFNRCQFAGSRLLIAAAAPPKQLGIQLPDLISRLHQGAIFQIHVLTDDEKVIVLQLWAQRHGLKLSSEVAQFLLVHSSRELSDLFALLERLDRASLVEQRKLTIPFVKNYV